MSDPALSSEELDFIREVFSSQLIGKPLSIPAFKVDGGPLANALLTRLGLHANLSLEAKLDRCHVSFPLQLVEDELHGLQLEMGAPNIFEEGAVRDLRQAMDHLAATRGVARFVAVGLCSGADVSLKLAAEDPRLAQAVLVDPFSYETRLFWLQGYAQRLLRRES